MSQVRPLETENDSTLQKGNELFNDQESSSGFRSLRWEATRVQKLSVFTDQQESTFTGVSISF